MGDTELESVASTMSTSERNDRNAAIRNAKRDASERMHLWMHQDAGSDERSVALVLAEAIAETLGNDALGRVVSALEDNPKATG